MQLFGKQLGPPLEPCAPIIIAEIGVNHEGSRSKAADLMDSAIRAGADAVKLQYGTVTSGPPRKGKDFTLNEGSIRLLAAYARKQGYHLFSSALSMDALPLCAELFSVIKIASRDNRNEELIRAAAATDKPVIISAGGISDRQMYNAVKWCGTNRPVIMHCVSEYPTPIDRADIHRVYRLRGSTGRSVGYSNHVVGPEACYMALGYGAKVIEVHFTDDKNREFRDHQMSFDAKDLANFVRTANRMWRAR
jgi:N,N'-diacetyllegionaminate synthase